MDTRFRIKEKNMKVPFIDLRMQHQLLKEDLDQAIQGVMLRGDFALGKDVNLFEEEFADFCGAGYAVGVDSGLSALELSLRAYGVGAGDEVIVPAHTFIATAAAATFAGAEPVLVDVSPNTYNIDVAKIKEAITSRTKAIIPVHLYGLPAQMDEIMDLANRHGLVVIEDACQAHGARFQGQRTGSLGHAAAFSFYPTKNLGGCGDGGMVVTNDERVAEEVRALRNCGQREKGYHELAPFNHRLDTLQAAILRVKLRHLQEWVDARRRLAALYTDLLSESGEMAVPTETPGAEHVYHLYVIWARNRDEMRSYLQERGIGTGIHYPIPVHLQPFYMRQPRRTIEELVSTGGDLAEAEGRYHRGQFPVTEKLCEGIVSLPMFPEMTEEQVRYVATSVLEFLEQTPVSLSSYSAAEV
jgi:dTDP-4-amino-4,6-dideoxygalactose transaminase